MNPYTHGYADPLLLLQAPLQWPECFDDAQTYAHSALRIVFVRPRIPKIDQQPIAQILGDVPIKALNDLRTDRMIGPYHLAQLFGVQMCGEGRRIDEVAKQQRQMTALGLQLTLRR
jgi:hypothetical protein